MSFPDGLNPDDPSHAWRLAFACFVAKLIVDADGIVDFGELKLISQAFPDDLLARFGFLDAEGELNEAYREAYVAAAKQLPGLLSDAEKLELITLFHRTAMADGELIQAELLVLREAAEVLGLSVTDLSRHLEGLRSLSGARRR